MFHLRLVPYGTVVVVVGNRQSMMLQSEFTEQLVPVFPELHTLTEQSVFVLHSLP